MTRKDYIKIAQAIKDSKLNDTQYLIKDSFVDIMCDMLYEDNNLFDRARFKEACE